MLTSVSCAGSHDKSTWIATSIAELLFSSKEHQGAGQSYADYVTHIRGLYHKTILAPLRKCLDITEVSFYPAGCLQS